MFAQIAFFLIAAAETDPHSFSNPNEIKISSFDLDLSINMQTQTLAGRVEHHLDSVQGHYLKLDTMDLKVTSVQLRTRSGERFSTQWFVAKADPTLGSPLTIVLPHQDIKDVIIHYEVPTHAAALGWIDRNQTETKKSPFLFVFSSSHKARSWIPLQDQPSVRYKFKARIHTSPDVMVAMSAPNILHKRSDGIYKFETPESIPPYLLGLVAGDFNAAQFGRITGFAEPSPLAIAKEPLELLDRMLVWIEKKYGRMPWSGHGVIFMPRTFPVGGMEVPYLNYLTINALGSMGRSVLWHELVHSWCGNMVTCETLDHFWLNEGLTVYIERRITEEFEGAESAALSAHAGYQELKLETDESFADSTLYYPLQNLHPSRKLRDAPYEKGYLFWRHLEKIVGQEELDKFIRRYFESFRFRSINSEEFIRFVESNLLLTDDLRTLGQLRKWVYSPGLPDASLLPPSKWILEIKDLVEKFNKNDFSIVQKLLSLPDRALSSFLSHLRDARLSPEQMQVLDQNLQPLERPTAVAIRWLILVARNNYQKDFAEFEKAVKTRAIGGWAFSEWVKGLALHPEGKELIPLFYQAIQSEVHSGSRDACLNTLKDIAKKDVAFGEVLKAGQILP